MDSELEAARGAPAPLPPRLVPRRRIADRISLLVEHPLVLVTGTPGAGKSVAIAEWALDAGTDVAWVTLEARDDYRVAFWPRVHAVLAGLRRTRDPGAAIPSSRDADEHSVLRLLSDLADGSSPRVHLVLDDFEVITDDRILDGVAFLVDHLPKRCSMIVASRVDPPFPLARWRGRGVMGDLRQQDLAFTVAETGQLLAKFGVDDIDGADVEVLTDRTEGWVAALQLAALILQEHDDRAACVKTFAGSHRMVADLLTTEVLARQPADVSEFLLRISVLDRFSAPLCNAMTGRSDAHELIQRLEANHVFVVPLDDDREWFRLHHLFRELLHHELRARHAEGCVGAHRDAARHLAQQGDKVAAAHQWVLARDLDQAFECIAAADLGTSWDPRVAGWIDLIPAAYVGESIERILVYCSVLARLDRLDDWEMWLHRADRRTHTPADARFRHLVDMHWTALHTRRGDAEAAIDEGTRLIGKDIGPAELVRVLPIVARAQIMRDDFDSAYSTMRRASAVERSGEDAAADLVISSVQALAHYGAGALDDALSWVDRAFTSARAFGLEDHPALLDVRATLAGVHCDRYEIPQASEMIDDVRRDAARRDNIPSLLMTGLIEARLLQVTDSGAAAIETIEVLRDAVEDRRAPHTMLRRINATEARIWLDGGDADRAAPLIEDLEPGTQGELLYAYLALVRGDRTAMYTHLGRAECVWPRAQLAESLLLLRASVDVDGDGARRQADQVVEIAAQHRSVLMLLAQPPLTLRLIRRAADSSRSVGAARLARALGAPQRAASVAPPLTTLSDRERTVLRFLPSQLTKTEIAAELYVSLNTVKTHCSAIYRKLEVRSRADAVSRARALGLISR